MVSNKNITFLALFLIVVFRLSAAEPVRFWIKFTDKNGSTFSTKRPAEFLSPAAVERRTRYRIAVDETDLPVIQNYINTVEAITNVKVVYASKWLNGVVIELDSIDLAAAALAQISTLSFVQGNQQVRKFKIDEGKPAPDKTAQAPTQNLKPAGQATTTVPAYAYGGSGAQIRQMQLECLHNQGFRGQGMTIAVLDAGFAYVDSNPVFDSLRNRNGIVGMRDFVSGGNNAFQGSTHGTMVLSCMAALKPGLIHGTAPLANYWLIRTEAPAEYLTEEYNWIRGAEFADSVGADILTTSLGYTEFDNSNMNHTYATLNGRTAPMSIASTMAARKGMFVLNAAGNERASNWHFIGVPADADSICTVGAIDSLGREAAFSSVGPTADGRIKPDFVTIGAGTWVSQITEESFPGNGTSFATPVLAGAVACFWQANRSLSNMDIMREMRFRGDNAGTPNNQIGWGVPKLCISTTNPFNFYYNKNAQRIEIVILQANPDALVQLFDTKGKMVFSQTLKADDRKIQIDAARLQEEIYILKFKSSYGTTVKKFFKN